MRIPQSKRPEEPCLHANSMGSLNNNSDKAAQRKKPFLLASESQIIDTNMSIFSPKLEDSPTKILKSPQSVVLSGSRGFQTPDTPLLESYKTRKTVSYQKLWLKKGISFGFPSFASSKRGKLAEIIRKKLIPRIRVVSLFVMSDWIKNSYDPMYAQFIEDFGEVKMESQKEIYSKKSLLNTFLRAFFSFSKKRRIHSPEAYKLNSLRKCLNKASVGSNWIESRFLIKPNGLVNITMCICFLFAMTFLAIILPFHLSFSSHISKKTEAFKLCAYFIVLIETILQFNTGIFKHGVSVMNRTKIIEMIIQKQRLPLTIYLAGMGTGSIFSLAFIVNLLSAESNAYSIISLLTLVKIKDVPQKYLRIQEYFVPSMGWVQIYRVIGLMVVLLFFGHIVSCAWFFLGQYELERIGQSWFIYSPSIDEAGLLEKYVTSYYWAMTMMATVGFGDIVAVTPNEKVFTIFMMLVSSGLFAYSINTIGAILNSFEEQGVEVRRRLAVVNYYMKNKDVRGETQERIREFLQYMLNKSNSRRNEENSLIEKLPVSLKKELILEVNGPVVSTFTLFWKLFSERVIVEMALKLKEDFFIPNDLILDSSKDENSVCLVYTGAVEIFMPGSKTSLAIKPAVNPSVPFK